MSHPSNIECRAIDSSACKYPDCICTQINYAEPIVIEEKIIKTHTRQSQLALRQSYIKGHINAIRTHVRKAKQNMVIAPSILNEARLAQASALLEKQLTKVERDAHDMLEIVKKAIK